MYLALQVQSALDSTIHNFCEMSTTEVKRRKLSEYDKYQMSRHAISGKIANNYKRY